MPESPQQVSERIVKWLDDNPIIRTSVLCEAIGMDAANFNKYRKMRSFPSKYLNPILDALQPYGGPEHIVVEGTTGVGDLPLPKDFVDTSKGVSVVDPKTHQISPLVSMQQTPEGTKMTFHGTPVIDPDFKEVYTVPEKVSDAKWVEPEDKKLGALPITYRTYQDYLRLINETEDQKTLESLRLEIESAPLRQLNNNQRAMLREKIKNKNNDHER